MRLALTIAGAITLASCGDPDPVAEEVENASHLPTINRSSASPTGAAPARGAPAGNAVGTPVSGTIPVALRGRWGLSPGDCDVPTGEAEGMLIISSDELRFYESRARPAAKAQTSSNSISGDFAFTGEGTSWTRHLSLEIRGGRLVRTERNPVASYRYVRCD